MLRLRRVMVPAALLVPVFASAQMVFTAGSPGPALTTPTSNTPPEQRCVVAGRVVNAQSGEALKKATVRLTRQGGSASSSGPPVLTIGTPGMLPANGMQGYSATSDTDGSFRIENVEPGEYILSGQRSGFLNTRYGAKGANQAGTVLNLQPAQQMTDLTLSLNPQAVITGKVVDSDGDPVAGAMVQVMAAMWQRGKVRYIPHGGNPTNDLGEFRIADLAPGKYYLCAQKMGFPMQNESAPQPGKPDVRPVRTCYPEATSFDTAMPVVISTGQDASGIDIHLHSSQTYHVRGRVVGAIPSGEGARAQIFVTHPDEDLFMLGNQATAGKDQTFDIAGVAPGSYLLNVMLPMQGPMRVSAHQNIEVGQGDLNDVVIQVLPAGTIRGQIRMEGTAQAGSSLANPVNVHIALAPLDSMRITFSQTQAKADGSFTLDNVSPGKYYVQANVPAGTYLKSVRFGQQEVAGKELDLSQSASGDLEVVFRYGVGEVDGTIQQPDTSSTPAGSSTSGQPGQLPAAMVLFEPDVLNADGSGFHFTSANQSGGFNMKQLPPGHYRAYAFEQTNANAIENPDLLKEFESRAVDVDVKENDMKQIQLPLISADDLSQAFAKLGIDAEQ